MRGRVPGRRGGVPNARPSRHLSGDRNRVLAGSGDAGNRGRAGPAVSSAEFRGDGLIGLGALGIRAVQRDGLAVAGGLGKPDVARDHGVEDGIAEVPTTSALTSEARFVRGSNIVSRTPLMARLGVQVISDEIDGGDQLRQSFECVVLTLDRDQHRVGRRERVDGQQPQGRRAIEEHVVVVVDDVVDQSGKASFSLWQRCEFHIGTRQRHDAGTIRSPSIWVSNVSSASATESITAS